MNGFPDGAVSTHVGYVEIVTVDTTADPAAGGPITVGRSPTDLVAALQHEHPGTIRQGGWETTLAAGDFAVFEASGPFQVRSEGRVVCFVVPRHALGLGSRDIRKLAGATIRGDQGLGALVSSFLTELAAGAAHWEPETGERLAGKAMDLLASLASEQITSGAERGTEIETRQAMLDRIKSYIAANLADPHLTPESIARAHHISLRYLYKLFQDEETTVGRWILRCRLEKCREELRSGRRSGPGVAVVAQRWGFVHPTQFTRAFRAAYGLSPSEWQAAAEDAEPRE